MYIIGIIAFSEQSIAEVQEIESGLNKLGYAVHLEQMGFYMKPPQLGDFYYEKESVVIWLCRCLEDVERCKNAAARFVEADVDAVVAMSRPAFEVALQDLGAETPILFMNITREPSAVSELAQLQRRRKVSGVWDTWLELARDRLALITELVPTPTTVHAVYNPDLPAVNAEADILRQAAPELNLKLILHEARGSHDGREQLAHLHTSHDHALFRLADPTTDNLAGYMGAIATEQDIPYVGLKLDELDRCGALCALETNGAGAQVAAMLDRIFQGENPSDIAFQEPTRRILALNLQAAQDLGLVVSPALSERAEFVIQAHPGGHLELQFLPTLILSVTLLGLILLFSSQSEIPDFLGLGLGAILLMTYLIWRYIHQRVVQPIRSLSIAAEKIGSGELNTPIDDPMAGNELDVLSRALRRMRNNLKTSYRDLEELNRELQQQLAELGQAYRIQKKAQDELALANRIIVDAEDNQRFALTTYIHDEVLRPMDDLVVIAHRLRNPELVQLSDELDQRIRQIRFDLSTPLLQDIGLELRRLIQEVLPALYPQARRVKMTMDLQALEQFPGMESAYVFLLYRFVRGAAANIYRHSQATQADILASVVGKEIRLRVSDNGQGFDPEAVERFVAAGHYFFYDIQVRVSQLGGKLVVHSKPGTGTALVVSLPIPRKTRKARSEINRRTDHKVP